MKNDACNPPESISAVRLSRFAQLVEVEVARIPGIIVEIHPWTIPITAVLAEGLLFSRLTT